MKYAADFREIARRSLQGRWLLAVVAGFIAGLFGVSLTGEVGNIDLNWEESSSGDTSVVGDSDIFGTFIAIAIPLVFILLIICVVLLIFSGAVTLGYARFNLNLVDARPARVNDLFACFDRLGAGFCLVLLRSIFVFLWSLLLVIPGIIKRYSYAMASYILLENPQMSASEAITASKQLMHGNKWRLFCLEFSFIGWELLCSLPVYILVWLVALMRLHLWGASSFAIIALVLVSFFL